MTFFTRHSFKSSWPSVWPISSGPVKSLWATQLCSGSLLSSLSGWCDVVQVCQRLSVCPDLYVVSPILRDPSSHFPHSNNTWVLVRDVWLESWQTDSRCLIDPFHFHLGFDPWSRWIASAHRTPVPPADERQVEAELAINRQKYFFYGHSTINSNVFTMKKKTSKNRTDRKR